MTTHDLRTELSEALEEDHVGLCRDATCDIAEAAAQGFVFAAAHLLVGATEAEATEAVVDADPEGYGAGLGEEWPQWQDHVRTWGRRCGRCGGVTFADRCWEPEECGCCGAEVGLRSVTERTGELVLKVSHVGRDAEGRQVYRYRVNCGARAIEAGEDLRSGVGAGVDVRDAMATLLAFLTTAAEQYGRTMGVDTDDYVLSVEASEAAFENLSELELIALDYEDDRQGLSV